MKAKIFFSLVVFIIFNTSATSQMVQKTTHRIEKTIIKTQKLMYANAKSGLIIRKEPSVNSDKIGKFNYSDQVLIIKKTQRNEYQIIKILHEQTMSSICSRLEKV